MPYSLKSYVVVWRRLHKPCFYVWNQIIIHFNNMAAKFIFLAGNMLCSIHIYFKMPCLPLCHFWVA